MTVALLVDAADKSVIAFRANRSPDVLIGSDRIDLRIDLNDVLPGFELTVAELFSSLADR